MKILKIFLCLMLVSAVANAQWVPKQKPTSGGTISSGKTSEKGSAKEAPVPSTILVAPMTVQPATVRPSQPSLTGPAQEMESLVARECAKPLEIEIVEPRDLYPGDGASHFVPGRSARNYATFDDPVTARFRANGGIGDYLWEVKSATEEYFHDAYYCEDPSRCMPHMFSLSRTPGGPMNNTYDLNGSFTNSLMYCLDDMAPTVVEADGTAHSVRRPNLPSCIGPEYLVDDLTIKVTDNCPTKRTTQKTFTFIIQSPTQHVSDLIAAEIRLRPGDYERGIDYVYLIAYDIRGGHVAETHRLYPWQDHWIQYRTKFERKSADVLLHEITAIKMRLVQAGSSIAWYDVDVDNVMIYSKYWYFECNVDDNFEVLPHHRGSLYVALCSSPRLKRFSQPIADGPLADVERLTDTGWVPW